MKTQTKIGVGVALAAIGYYLYSKYKKPIAVVTSSAIKTNSVPTTPSDSTSKEVKSTSVPTTPFPTTPTGGGGIVVTGDVVPVHSGGEVVNPSDLGLGSGGPNPSGLNPVLVPIDANDLGLGSGGPGPLPKVLYPYDPIADNPGLGLGSGGPGGGYGGGGYDGPALQDPILPIGPPEVFYPYDPIADNPGGGIYMDPINYPIEPIGPPEVFYPNDPIAIDYEPASDAETPAMTIDMFDSLLYGSQINPNQIIVGSGGSVGGGQGGDGGSSLGGGGGSFGSGTGNSFMSDWIWFPTQTGLHGSIEVGNLDQGEYE